MKKSRLIYILFIILVLASYLYFSRADNTEVRVIENQQANTSIPVNPNELEELKKDPSAPTWLKDVESCTWVGQKVFCKLRGANKVRTH